MTLLVYSLIEHVLRWCDIVSFLNGGIINHLTIVRVLCVLTAKTAKFIIFYTFEIVILGEVEAYRTSTLILCQLQYLRTILYEHIRNCSIFVSDIFGVIFVIILRIINFHIIRFSSSDWSRLSRTVTLHDWNPIPFCFLIAAHFFL